MNEQMIIAFFMFLSAGITIFLSFWTAKKEMEYRKDERWRLIQNKANRVADYLLSILIILAAVGTTLVLLYDINISIKLDRILIYFWCYTGLRDAIELFALIYFDKKL